MKTNFTIEAFKAHPDAKVTTKEGTEVRILATDLRGSWPVVGTIYMLNVDEVLVWDENGMCLIDRPSLYDLVIEY